MVRIKYDETKKLYSFKFIFYACNACLFDRFLKKRIPAGDIGAFESSARVRAYSTEFVPSCFLCDFFSTTADSSALKLSSNRVKTVFARGSFWSQARQVVLNVGCTLRQDLRSASYREIVQRKSELTGMRKFSMFKWKLVALSMPSRTDGIFFEPLTKRSRNIVSRAVPEALDSFHLKAGGRIVYDYFRKSCFNDRKGRLPSYIFEVFYLSFRFVDCALNVLFIGRPKRIWFAIYGLAM